MTGPDSPPRRAIRLATLAPPALAMLAGLFVAILPHLMQAAKVGSPAWIADHDDLLYLTYTSRAYVHHPASLDDPMDPDSGICTYPWLQMGPAVLTARALGLGPLGVSIVWRAWGGLAMPLMAYFLLEQAMRGAPGLAGEGRRSVRRWVAAGLAALTVSDPGFVGGQPWFRQAQITAQVLSGRIPADLLDNRPQIHREWRVITPAISLPFLLAFAWLLSRAREAPSRGRIVASGIAYGLLFHVYFYFWTAATVALGLLALVDRSKRRVALGTGVLGGLIGLPAVLSTSGSPGRSARRAAHGSLAIG